jgi:anaerobic magnesium-protoporphyrin IX monomethyl ester cyclase
VTIVAIVAERLLFRGVRVMARQSGTVVGETVLIVTGGYLSAKDESLPVAAWKQLVQSRHARNSWLETKVKVTQAEPIMHSRVHAMLHSRDHSPQMRELLRCRDNFSTPELTEVVLATALAQEGVSFETLTIDQLFRGGPETHQKLAHCAMVFASSTFLRDLSELEPVLHRLSRPWNRVVVGGPLASTLQTGWDGSPLCDVLAVGYGEMLIPTLVRWMRSGFTALVPGERGRVIQRAHTALLFSGTPDSMSLDHLARPDWGLIERHHGADYPMIHYESVRGCPYRCGFCNYPFLFDDTKFRTKSAQRMADDWEYYAQTLGIEYITCLDSLFTMPKKRVIEFCEELVRRNVRIKWICYARADDLCDASLVALLRAAGCVQVQIGIESGDQGQLDRMTKRTTVAQNGIALDTCRAAGLTTVISLVVGFPGETQRTVDATREFLRCHPSDFHFLATFSTRVANVPILEPQNAAQHALTTDTNSRTVSPYWRHATMSCADVGNHTRSLARALISERISLDAAVFYNGILRYTPALREEMLDFQAAALNATPVLRHAFNALNGWIDRRLRVDVDHRLGSDRPHAAQYLPVSALR